MKIKKSIKTAMTLLAVALGSVEARAESASDIGTLPSQRIPAAVDSGDRNPFATTIAIREDIPGNFEGDSEESRIRKVFQGLKVTGRVGVARVLVGDLVLKEGAIVPQVIENQTDILKVTKITDTEVELTWIDEEVVDSPRKLPIPIELDPVVSFVLPGRSASSGGQFVTMSKKDDLEAVAETENSIGGEDEFVEDEVDEDDEDGEERQSQPNKPKRVSPFGLFRR